MGKRLEHYKLLLFRHEYETDYFPWWFYSKYGYKRGARILKNFRNKAKRRRAYLKSKIKFWQGR